MLSKLSGEVALAPFSVEVFTPTPFFSINVEPSFPEVQLAALLLSSMVLVASHDSDVNV